MNGLKEAVVRLIVFAILAINQALILYGYNPLPFSEEEIFVGISSAAVVAQGLYVWFRNNNVTEEAQQAQKVLDELKAEKQEGDK